MGWYESVLQTLEKPGSFTLLHFHFGGPQKGPVFLLFLPFCICLEVPPAVHASVPTLLDKRKGRLLIRAFILNLHLTEKAPQRDSKEETTEITEAGQLL